MAQFSIVRENLMNQRGYTPYCGHVGCRTMPRTRFDPSRRQFMCPACGWTSQYERTFIDDWEKKWCK